MKYELNEKMEENHFEKKKINSWKVGNKGIFVNSTGKIFPIELTKISWLCLKVWILAYAGDKLIFRSF